MSQKTIVSTELLPTDNTIRVGTQFGYTTIPNSRVTAETVAKTFAEIYTRWYTNRGWNVEVTAEAKLVESSPHSITWEVSYTSKIS